MSTSKYSLLHKIEQAVHDEIISADHNWPDYNSAHEGWGVLMEEVKELTDHVFMKQKNRDLDAMKKEAIQIAAVAIRFARDVCNEEVGRS